jgi:hypothetical protein
VKLQASQQSSQPLFSYSAAFQPFIESRMPTEGFERASADFEQCLAQLELIAR